MISLRHLPRSLFTRASVVALVALGACSNASTADTVAVSTDTTSAVADEPSPVFRNIAEKTAYVGDSACVGCHQAATKAYQANTMAQSFHQWTPDRRIETKMDSAIVHARSGYRYKVIDSAKALWQVEYLQAPNGIRVHELKRRIDYVIGSGRVARTYFTQENGRLFQLPLTWYREHGWDMSPGYDVNNARFSRLLPDQCVACHASYPTPRPHLEAKFDTLRDGIGCERCHGPGALHVTQRSTAARGVPGAPADSAFDATIVNPARLSLERRLDVCEQCHVHTVVSVLREKKTDFSYLPSQPLRDQRAFFKNAGGIDLVSHADRLRQSQCFLASRSASKPLECASCHNPHEVAAKSSRNASCKGCHESAALAKTLASSPARAQHTANADCASCHMPKVADRAVHGAFTDHWIRVVKDTTKPVVTRADLSKIVAYFERDRRGPEAAIYSGMGAVMNATLNQDPRDLARSADALRSALGNDTTRASAQFLLGVALQQVGRVGEAIPVLERAVLIDSTRPDALRALAQAYQSSGKKPEQIEPLYRRALMLQPALARIRADYGEFLTARGRDADAERAFREAVSEEPSRATAWFNLGAVLLQQSKNVEAANAFREAVALEPLIAEALHPLVQVATSGKRVVSVTALNSPVLQLPLRDDGPGVFRVAVADPMHLGFTNVTAKSFVLILKTDGSLLFALPTNAEGVLLWDLMTPNKEPLAPGLYRAELRGRDSEGRPVEPRSVFFGLVRAGDANRQ